MPPLLVQRCNGTTAAQPNLNIVFLLIHLHTVTTYEINVQKEWHWPPFFSMHDSYIVWSSAYNTYRTSGIETRVRRQYAWLESSEELM